MENIIQQFKEEVLTRMDEFRQQMVNWNLNSRVCFEVYFHPRFMEILMSRTFLLEKDRERATTL